tara:strand:+ start:913 stop:2697 length:1785 start_codon:yes stop_codon:yes gene_type:complete
MSSITRKKLARGTRLYTDHVVGPLQAASVALSGNIAPEQMQEPKGTFRVNLHVPCIDSTFWGINSAYEDNRYSIPFVLPPFQQDVDITAGVVRTTPNTYEYSPSAPRFYLDEISFGFDQRGEACVIADRLFDFTAAANAVQDGQMNFADITKLNIKLSLFEHKMTYWDQQEDPANATKSDKVNVGRELWGVSMSNVVYAGKNHRENPVMVDNLDLEIFPHKSYAFAISAPELSHPGGDNKPSYALSSATISLKIRTDLVSRDTRASDSVQNIPIKHNGAPTNEAVTVVTPAAGSVITADQSGGISQNLSVIDSVFRDKLNAGYTKNAETVPHQNLLKDSCYEIIAVPLFQGRRYQTVVHNTLASEAYFDSTAGAGSQFIADRRIVPIEHPFVLHHVILAWNWQKQTQQAGIGASSYMIPESSGFTVDVGVGMATGLESDMYTYEQLARTTMTAPDWIPAGNKGGSWFTKCIDRIRCMTPETRLGQAESTSAGNPRWWDWELHQVSLEGTGGAGYFAQGRPIFIGKGWSPTWTRTTMAATGAASTTLGSEQFIEVRMRMRDTAQTMQTAPSSGTLTMYSGYQGHWVYLIGKKALV